MLGRCCRIPFFIGNPDAALKAGKRAAEIKGNAEIFALGVYASKTNRDESIDHYRKAVSIDPASLKAWVNMGNCLLDCQRIEDSIAAFNEALKLDSSCFQTLMGLSRAYGGLAKWLESLDMSKQALSLCPTSHDAAFWIGYSLHKLERKTEAINAYRAALSIPPVAAQTHLLLGSALESIGEEESAISCYGTAFSLDQSDPRPLLYSAALAHKRGDLLYAIEKYQMAVKVGTNLVTAYLGLALAFKEVGNIDKAILNFKVAIDIKPDLAYGFFELATIFNEENMLDDASILYASAFSADPELTACFFHCNDTYMKNISLMLDALRSKIASLLDNKTKIPDDDAFFLCCIYEFFERRGIEINPPPAELKYTIPSLFVSFQHSAALNDLLGVYLACRKALLPRWLVFEGVSSELLLISDYLESLRIKRNLSVQEWMLVKNYQLATASVDGNCLLSGDQLFVKTTSPDESLWLSAERFQFPDLTPALSLQESFSRKSPKLSVSQQDQSEFFRKTHLLDAQKFYIAEKDPCLHGCSELYRVHGLIIEAIAGISGLQSVVFGYYSCGIFNAGLTPNLKRYCIEPSRHHALWVTKSGIAEVLPDVPEKCVRSFDEYLSRLDLVFLDDPGSTAAVLRSILQLFEYRQCVEILQKVKGFASCLVIGDDILNEESEESILRLLSNGKRLNLCHNYQRMLSDAGWRIENKWYFHGVRYNSGIIVASSC